MSLGWFMFGNRQHSLTLAVGNSRGDGTYYATVSDFQVGDSRQVWKWEGDWLVSKWNTEYVLDGSSDLYIISKRNKSKYQRWRFSMKNIMFHVLNILSQGSLMDFW